MNSTPAASARPERPPASSSWTPASGTRGSGTAASWFSPGPTSAGRCSAKVLAPRTNGAAPTRSKDSGRDSTTASGAMPVSARLVVRSRNAEMASSRSAVSGSGQSSPLPNPSGRNCRSSNGVGTAKRTSATDSARPSTTALRSEGSCEVVSSGRRWTNSASGPGSAPDSPSWASSRRRTVSQERSKVRLRLKQRKRCMVRPWTSAKRVSQIFGWKTRFIVGARTWTTESSANVSTDRHVRSWAIAPAWQKTVVRAACLRTASSRAIGSTRSGSPTSRSWRAKDSGASRSAVRSRE